MKNKKICFISNISLITLIFGMLFINLIQSNEASKEGFLLRALNQKLVDLKNENKDLVLVSTQLQSIERIKNDSEKILGMVDTDNIDYIVSKNNTKEVAIK